MSDVKRDAGGKFAEGGGSGSSSEDSGHSTPMKPEEKHAAVTSALEKLAKGSGEETIPDLRDDLEQYGGTNDVTLMTGDAKKGLVHIAKRHGEEVIPGVLEAVVDGSIVRFSEGNKTLVIGKGNYEAVLSLEEHGKKKTWLLTGFDVTVPKNKNKGLSDERGKVRTRHAPTHGEPILSRHTMGADSSFTEIIAQILQNASRFSNARIQNWRIDDDGFMRVTAHVLKEGVYPYTAQESFGAAEALPGVDTVMQYIPRGAFTDEALASLEGKPVTVPLVAPGEEFHQWRDPGNALTDLLTVGSIAGRPRVTADGCIECDMLIMDADAIRAIEAKKFIEVSAGYHGEFAIQAGDYGGRPYHGVQGNLQFNHVLLLPQGAGRCGYDVRIINQKPEPEKGATMPTPKSIKTMIGNKARTLKFSNEDDAEIAENALDEQSAFNAESVQAAMTEITDLKAKLEEQTKLLEGAKKQIDELLSPAAQESMTQAVVDQKEDETFATKTAAEIAGSTGRQISITFV